MKYTYISNSTNKNYFKYALGEVILVALGILIALQVNNWNESRKKDIKEQEILLQLKKDYSQDLNQLRSKNGMRKFMIQESFNILHSFDHPKEASKDSLMKYFGNITINPTFDPIKNDINNSENIRIIKNLELKKLISHWSSDIIAVQEEEVNWTKFMYEQLLPIWTDLGLVRNMFNYLSKNNKADRSYLLDDTVVNNKSYGKSKLSASLKEILRNRKVESVVAFTIEINQTINLQGKALEDRITRILKLINSEIKS